MTKKLQAIILAVALAVTSWGTWWVTDAKWTKEVQSEYIKNAEARESERIAVQGAVNKVSKDYQDQLAELEGSTDRIIADLHSDGKRLRVKLKATGGTTEGINRCFPDGKAELDDGDAKRLIAVSKKGDLWIEALQETIRRLQKEGK